MVAECQGLVIRKTKPWLEARLVSATPPSFRDGRGAGNGVNNRSCLREEASIESQYHGVGGA